MSSSSLRQTDDNDVNDYLLPVSNHISGVNLSFHRLSCLLFIHKLKPFWVHTTLNREQGTIRYRISRYIVM